LYCTYALLPIVGWACLCPYGFLLLVKGIDSLSSKWRVDTYKKVSKATDARSGEITQTFSNIKTLKLFAWQGLFANRITERREIEESLVNKHAA